MLKRLVECWTPLNSAVVKYPQYAKDVPTDCLGDINDLIELLNPISIITAHWSSEKFVIISEVLIN